MATEPSTASERAALLSALFPGGVPRLWCPPLTHYDRHGAIDDRRIAAHLRHLAPSVKGVLMPGSTGDGWELTAEESSQVAEIASNEAEKLELRLLIGVLE